MSHADFVHLRVHTAYSLSEGAIKIGDLTMLCRDDAMPAVGVTDSCNMFGALEFSLAAAKAGVQPILGCQILVERIDVDEAFGAHGGKPAGDQLVLLARKETGYGNLLKLTSKSYVESELGEDPVLAMEWDNIGYCAERGEGK